MTRKSGIVLSSYIAVLTAVSITGKAFPAITVSLLLIYVTAILLTLKGFITPSCRILSLNLLSPLILISYSTPWDFSIRVAAFTLLIVLAGFRINTEKLNFCFRRGLTAFMTAFLILSAGALVFSARGGFLTGDEPHYLVMTQSIVEDRDFNVKNNYKPEKYNVYIKERIKPHAKDIEEGLYSYHLPGMAFILIPFYSLFKILSSYIPPHYFFRLSAALINSFTATFLLLIMYRLFPDRKKQVTGLWFILLSTFPLLTHSIHLFPELPAAGLFMAGFYFAVYKPSPLISGLLFSIIPWIHIKYSPALAIFAAYLLYKYLKEKNFKDLLLFITVPVLSLLTLLHYTNTIYGTLNPAGIYPKESYFSPPMLLRLKVFFSYFLDQRDGLLLYAPLFFLFFRGFKGKFDNKTMLTGILGFYVIMHASTTLRGAFAPQARPLMFTMWIMIIILANYWLNNQNRISSVLIRANYFIILWLLFFPFLNYQPVFSHTNVRESAFFDMFSTPGLSLSSLFPSFLTNPANTHTANYIWIILIAILSSGFLLKLKTGINKSPAFRILSVITLLVIIVPLALLPHTRIKRRNLKLIKGHPFYQSSGNFVYNKKRDHFRLLTGKSYDLFFDCKAQSHKPLVIEVHENCSTEISFFNGKDMIKPVRKGNRYFLNMQELKSFRSGSRDLIHLALKPESSSERFLFVKIYSLLFGE